MSAVFHLTPPVIQDMTIFEFDAYATEIDAMESARR